MMLTKFLGLGEGSALLSPSTRRVGVDLSGHYPPPPLQSAAIEVGVTLGYPGLCIYIGQSLLAFLHQLVVVGHNVIYRLAIKRAKRRQERR